MTTYQIATDPTGSSRAAISGAFPVQHITAVGDATPLCGRIVPTMERWSDPMDIAALGLYLVAPNEAVCGHCGDEFWMEANG